MQRRAFDDTEAKVSVFLHKTCCGYSLELPWKSDSGITTSYILLTKKENKKQQQHQIITK